MKNNYVVALGFFDGVHAAHKELFRLAKNEAQRLGCSTAAISECGLPKTVCSPKQPPSIKQTICTDVKLSTLLSA